MRSQDLVWFVAGLIHSMNMDNQYGSSRLFVVPVYKEEDGPCLPDFFKYLEMKNVVSTDTSSIVEKLCLEGY